MKKTGRKLIALLLALALILSDGGILVWAEGAEAQTAAVSAQTENEEEAILADTEAAEVAAEYEISNSENTEAEVTASVELAAAEAETAVGETAEVTVSAADTENEAAEAVAETVTGGAGSMATAEGLTWISVNVYDYDEMNALLETYQSIISGSAGVQKSDSETAERVEQLEERLLNSFMSYEPVVDLSDSDYTLAEYRLAMYNMTRLDYRLFFIDPVWQGVYYTDTGIMVDVQVTFLMDEDEVATAMAELEAVICEIVNAADESWSDLEKILYLNDYLVRNCEYDLTYSDYTAYGALVEHTTVCMGYTMAFYELAERMGLVCGAIESASMNHIWNYVCMDGNYYCVDTTWDDPTQDRPGGARHTYLLKSCTWFMSDDGGHNADDWMYLGDNADEMSEESFADTSYDEYFWDDIIRGFEYIDGYWYAMDNGVLTEYFFSGEDNSFTPVRTLITVSDTWYVWGDTGRRYTNSYASLASYEGVIYYSNTTTVFAYNLSTDSVEEIYELSEDEAAQGYIYGLLISDGILEYFVSPLPSKCDEAGIYTLMDLDTSDHTEIGDCKIVIDDSNLVYNGSLQLPDITITDGSYTLVEGVDYVAASFDNVSVGEKELCIVGIGDYTGAAEESFIILYEAPELTSIYNASDGVVFTFDTVDGVGKYRVYRRESASDAWESIGYVSSSPCRDENVESGKTYYYALQYYTADYKTALSALSDTGSQICYLSTPELTNYITYTTKMEIRWTAVSGAAKYIVYYKVAGSSSWTTLGSTTSTSYTFTNVSSGTYYYFNVCAVDSTGNYTSGMETNGYKCLFLSGVDFSVSIASSGMKITWSKVNGAGGYYIYRQADGESSSTLVKNITSSDTLNWTDTSVTSGTTYTYYVNAYYDSVQGAKRSATLAYIGPCSVSYVCNTMDGLKVAWNEVQGASGYFIYRRNSDGTYSTTPTDVVTSGSTTNWTDTSTLTGGKDYTYKVAAYGYASTGSLYRGASVTTKTCKYLKGGEVTSVVNTSSGPKVTWTKVSGANGYYIYRCVSGGDYVLAATVSGTSVVSWTDTSSLTSGKNYTYKVAPFFKNSSNQVTKGGAKTTKTVKYLTAGKISSLSNTSSGIYIKWSKVTGATGYYIYRKASSASSYTLVKTITSVGTVSYTDTAVKSSNNVTYTYYVMPYFKNSAGAITKAGYTTKTTVRLVATSVSSLTNSASKKMTVKWSKKTGVTGYQIQYSTSSSFASGNKTVTVTGASSVSKTISSLTKGKTYYVRIRTYKTVNGTNYYSAWSSSKSVKISK